MNLNFASAFSHRLNIVFHIYKILHLQTYHIHINGIVQGVGFRPMIYQVAKAMELNGYVKNSVDGVHVYFNAYEQQASLFYSKILEAKPAKAKIISSELLLADAAVFSDFSIQIESIENSAKQVLMSPDTAICPNCRNELKNSNDRRFRYPFITCTQCGPRYSIIESLPYERHGTSMQKFSLCKNCLDEYNVITDPRFFSQTNSCADCGIELRILESASNIVSTNAEEVLSYAAIFLQ
ncbi:MAG: acylphosphatase, partial [Bacteroidota bacterium]|nr:acylphosphatase [Bacteroidota bacterium]